MYIGEFPHITCVPYESDLRPLFVFLAHIVDFVSQHHGSKLAEKELVEES